MTLSNMPFSNRLAKGHRLAANKETIKKLDKELADLKKKYKDGDITKETYQQKSQEIEAFLDDLHNEG
jgi:uncharacterized membrane protein